MPAKTSGGFLMALLGHLFQPWRSRNFVILVLFLSLPLGFAPPAFGQNPTNVSTLVFPPNNAVNVDPSKPFGWRSEEHTSELQSRGHLVCRLLLEKKKHSPKYLCNNY